MKKFLLALVTAGLVAATATSALAQAEKKEKKAKKADSMQSGDTSPKTVIHVVTVNFKAEATKEQIQAAVDGVKKLPSQYKGITHVWTRPIKNQTDKSHILIMEFASEQALKDYAGSDAQKEWYKAYEGIRDSSTTFDVTN
jgi:uncharacterized membrane protein YdfJ with MMPL/SSD domain